MKKLDKKVKIVIVVLVSVFVLAITSASVYAAYINYQHEVDACNEIVNEYKQKGIITEENLVDCNQGLNTNLKPELEAIEKNLLTEITTQTQTNSILEEELKFLEIKLDEKTDISKETDLTKILKIETDRNTYLTEQKRAALKTLETSIADYEKKLNDNNSIQNYKTYSDFIKKYKVYEEKDKIQSYADFKKQKVTLEKEIEETKKITEAAQKTASITITPIDLDKYKTFSASGFVDLYFSLKPLPNTKNLTISPSITGNTDADKHIVALAEARGYKLQSEVQIGLVAVGGQQLQPEAKQAYLNMVADAAKSGFYLSIVSGFRDVDTQRSLFLNRFRNASRNQIGREYKSQEIIDGKADQAIETVLKTSSIPGYSRHHTGMTFDIGKSGTDFTRFKYTNEFAWISANNYLNAKRFGFIPSYPEGAPNQGPNPEAWEFTYVGQSALLR